MNDSDPAGGKGGNPDGLSVAIAKAKAAAPGLLDTLVSHSKDPTRQTPAVVAAARLILDVAGLDDKQPADAAEQAPTTIARGDSGSVTAVRDELTARMDREREAERKRQGEYDA